MEKNIAILLLAAGSSTRLKEPKQLLDIHGQPLLLRSVETAYACAEKQTFVVLGSEFEMHKNLISDLPVKIIQNKSWEKGMGNSIKAGLSYIIKAVAQVEAVIIMVCDQPLVTTAYLEKMIQKYSDCGKRIIASSYAATLGVPALFHKSIFPSILQLDDTHGAKMIIESNPEDVETISFPEGAIDIDTSQDYQNFLKIN
ncbi:MAG TPA: nucleotidyltransferase family protein [Cytophagales bacterium]|nr:nucleotidyltransferase family protein [Cytophagales bacterium]